MADTNWDGRYNATFQFKMEEYWSDLQLSESESRDINIMKQKTMKTII